MKFNICNLINNLKTKNEAKRINFYRIIALIITFLYPGSGLMYKLANPEILDPLSQRLIFSFLFCSLVLLSFINNHIRDKFRYLIYFSFFLLSIHAIYLINLNWHAINYAYGVIFIIIVGNIIIKNLIIMLSYNILMYSLIVYSLFNVGVIEINKISYLFFITLTIIVSAVINYSEIKLWKRLNHRIQEQELVEEKLKYRVELDKIITNLSTYFINLAPDQVIEGIKNSLQQVATFINADKSFLMLINLEEVISYGCKENKVKLKLVDYPELESAIKEFQTINFPEQKIAEVSKKVKTEAQELSIELEVEEFALIPVISHQELIAYLYFGANKKQNWTEKIVLLLKIVGEIFANAIERKIAADKVAEYTMGMELANLKLEETSQKLKERIDKAKKLHQQFLTQDFPEIPALSFAAHYYPAENLGGDFYNVFQVENKLITYIVDITGHGLDGAMLNIFVRESINSYLLANYQKGDELSPAEIIEFIFTRYKKENFPEDYFICLLLGVLDLKTMEYSFVNSGIQIQPLLINSLGEAEEIKISGLPISNTLEEKFFTSNNLKQESISFKAGDTVLMVTDGIVEEEVNQKNYGKKRYKEVVSNLTTNEPKDLINSLNSDFKDFSGSLQGQDDITILALKRNKNIK